MAAGDAASRALLLVPGSGRRETALLPAIIGAVSTGPDVEPLAQRSPG